MPDLLDAYLTEERLKPFAWGQDNGDCILFITGWMKRLRWPDAGDCWRGRYSNEAEARVIWRQYGNTIEAVSSIVGRPLPSHVGRRGDVGLFEIDDWHLGAICTGNMWAWRSGARGIRMFRHHPSIVWSLGF